MPARGEPQWRPARYVAFVLHAGEPDNVRMIDLGEAERIDQLVADFRAGVIDAERDRNMTLSPPRRPEVPSPAETVGLSTQLRAAVFDRLMPALGGRTRLLIAPDGDLTRLPFEVLPGDDGGRLIDGYRISYLTCGRDVLRFGTGVTGQPGDPLVVADPDFDLEAPLPTGPVLAKPGFWSRILRRGKKAIATLTPSVPTPATTVRSAERHSRDLDRDRDSYHFHRLPGTRAEGEWVATRLGVYPWLDATALEGRLKAECHSTPLTLFR